MRRYQDLLGRIVRLTIRGLGKASATLGSSAESADSVDSGLPISLRELPEGAAVGDEILVFVHLDSEDRPVATTRTPKLLLGEVAFLEVVDLAPFGAFFDWGLPKHLLVPKAEQTRDVRVGERHPIALYLDDTGRLAGTMRVSEELPESSEFEIDEWVDGEAWRKEPGIGVFVIVERTSVGLLPESEPHALERGGAGRFRITRIHRDGRFELSLRAAAHQEIESDAEAILQRLRALHSSGSAPRLADHSSPEEIRAAFGLSKKAFKRAVGGLLKRGVVRLDAEGFVVLSDV